VVVEEVRKEEFNAQVEAMGVLRDPVRRSLYRHVAKQPEAVSRDDAARATGISRVLAAFHLDRLVEAGLLETLYRRLSGRSGPGAGRPAKLYRRADRQFWLALPDRRYDLLAQILAQALEPEPEPSIRNRLAGAAKRIGARLGQEARDRARARDKAEPLHHALEVLEGYGYEPAQRDDLITLQNCPFHALAQQHRDLVCGVNLSLMEGFVDGIGISGLSARLHPAGGRCCVEIQLAVAPSTESGSS
jgi:predicted ArsR family transcriptional regulator